MAPEEPTFKLHRKPSCFDQEAFFMFAQFSAPILWSRRSSSFIVVVALLAFASCIAPLSGNAQKVTATLAIGCPAYSIAVNQNTNKIYIVCDWIGGGGDIVVIDGATNNVTTISTSYYPESVAVNPTTNNVYIAAENSSGDETILVLAGATNKITEVPVSFATFPTQVVVNPTNNKVYVYNKGSDDVTLLKGATNAVSEISVSKQYDDSKMTLDSVSNNVFISSSTKSSIEVIDGSANTVSIITNPSFFLFDPFATAIGTSSDQAYISYGIASTTYASEMVVVNAKTKATSTFAIPTAAGFGSYAGPTLLAFNTATNELFAADQSGHAAVIDVAAGTATAFSVGSRSYSLVVDPVANAAYVANEDSNTVTVINRAKNTKTTVAVGNQPTYLAVNTATDTAYVLNSYDSTVTVISGPSEASVATTTSLTSSENPQQPGASVTFTAKVKAASGTATPTGNVVFAIDGKTAGTEALSAGEATYTTSSLAAGTHTVKASYAGASGFSASSASLTETIETAAAVPTIKPDGGTFGLAQAVTLGSTTSKAAIYYTTNGTTPTTASTKYSAPFVVRGTETVEAIAAATGFVTSAPAKATFTLIDSPAVLTGVATGITAAGATLTATVFDQGGAAQVWFLWGASATALSSATAKASLGPTGAAQSIGVTLTNLQSKKTYYFQPVAKTIGGTTYGAVQSLTTD